MITEYKVKLPTDKDPTIKDFIKFFNAIPANEWCVSQLEDNTGRRCANGHANAFYGKDGFDWGDRSGTKKCPENLVPKIVCVLTMVI